jgi:hypothetical protein
MNTIKINFAKDKEGRAIVYACCNHGAIYCESWETLSDEMQMILRAIANPEKCKIEVGEKGFEDVMIEE